MLVGGNHPLVHHLFWQKKQTRQMFRGGFQLAHWTDPSMENLSESTLTLISLELGRGRQKRGHLAPRSLTLALTAAQPPDLNITSQICFYQMLPLTQPVPTCYCKEKYWFFHQFFIPAWLKTNFNKPGGTMQMSEVNKQNFRSLLGCRIGSRIRC